LLSKRQVRYFQIDEFFQAISIPASVVAVQDLWMRDNDILPGIALFAQNAILISGAVAVGFFVERSFLKPSSFDFLLWPLPLILAYLNYLTAGAHAKAMIAEGVHLRRRCIVHLKTCPVDEYLRNAPKEWKGGCE
jgi:hypothetical protein